MKQQTLTGLEKYAKTTHPARSGFRRGRRRCDEHGEQDSRVWAEDIGSIMQALTRKRPILVDWPHGKCTPDGVPGARPSNRCNLKPVHGVAPQTVAVTAGSRDRNSLITNDDDIK